MLPECLEEIKAVQHRKGKKEEAQEHSDTAPCCGHQSCHKAKSQARGLKEADAAGGGGGYEDLGLTSHAPESDSDTCPLGQRGRGGRAPAAGAVQRQTIALTHLPRWTPAWLGTKPSPTTPVFQVGNGELVAGICLRVLGPPPGVFLGG